MTPLGYVSNRLKILECEKKAFLEEQAKKEEQFRHLEEESQVMIEIERKSYQEAHDLLVAQQLDNEFNNVHIGGGNNSPALTLLETPRNGKH